MIKLTTDSDVKFPITYNVFWENGKRLGYFRLDVDGYYYFEELPNGGYWSAHSLRYIADKLDEINKPYDDEVNQYFNNLKQNGED